MAWIDLLLLANHKDGGFMVQQRSIWVTINRGQVGMSVESLSKRWQWSRGKTERWLKLLENARQIVRQKTNVTTVISILNYEQYQLGGNANGKTGDNAGSNAGNKQTMNGNNDKAGGATNGAKRPFSPASKPQPGYTKYKDL